MWGSPAGAAAASATRAAASLVTRRGGGQGALATASTASVASTAVVCRPPVVATQGRGPSSAPALAFVAIGWKRSFATTDGPFKYFYGNTDRFTKGRKKHYNEVLVSADRRKLLEVAQDLLSEPPRRELKPAFWEILSKRCLKSMHLFAPLETAIVLRAFDVYDVQLRGLDVFAAAAPHVLSAREMPGHAVVVFADVFPRRLGAMSRKDMQDLMQHLGRKAANAMWEIAPHHAVGILSAMSAVGAQDPALSARVARKVMMQLDVPGVLALQDLAIAAQAMAAQGHRDVDLLRGIAENASIASFREERGFPVTDIDVARAEVARRIVQSFEALEVDEVPADLQKLASH